jgi:predicted amidohydrolase YtcJ
VQQADLVIVNAKIWTGAKPPARKLGRPFDTTALAIAGHTIVAVGDNASVQPRIGPGTRVIDAKGQRVIPGMTDSHTHIVSGGFQLARLSLRNVAGREEFIRAVAEDVKTKKKGEWIVGGRWSVESWSDPQPPNKDWLDPITGNTPVYLVRMDGHQALVNSAALRLAGIDASGPKDPPGGEIVRDPKTGEPTGILKESAGDLVSDLIPDPTVDQRYEALRRAMQHANALGITSVHDMSEPDDLEVFRRAHREGALTIRITTYLMVDDWAPHIDKVEGFPIRDDMFRIAGFKGFMDGSLGSRTAYMRKPYSDAPAETPYPRGQLTAMAADTESFRASVAKIDARGLQVAVHAIGDEANHLLLDAYETVLRRNENRDARHRVEHAQHLHVSDIPRFAALGVVASMQPFHKADDGRYAEKRLGKERLNGSYAYRQLLDAGALVSFGSDWPVATMDPFAGIDAAVNARTLAGNVWLPTHSLTLQEALHGYTTSPPKAIHRGDRLGTIEVGKLADIVILADDPFTEPVDKVGRVRVDMTIVGGKVVYDRSR